MESNDDGDVQISQTNDFAVKPLTRRNTKKSKQLSCKHSKDNTASVSNLGKEEHRERSDFCSNLKEIDSSDVLPEKQNTQQHEAISESLKTTEKKITPEALKEVTPDAQKLVEIETISITKLPVGSFRQDSELPDNIPQAQKGVVTSTSFIIEQDSEGNSVKPVKEPQIKSPNDTVSLKTISIDSSSTKIVERSPATQTGLKSDSFEDPSSSKEEPLKEKNAVDEHKTAKKPKPEKDHKLKKKDHKEIKIEKGNVDPLKTSELKNISGGNNVEASDTIDSSLETIVKSQEKQDIKEIVAENYTKRNPEIVPKAGENVHDVNASNSPSVIEIELNYDTPLGELAEDVIKPLLQRSSPNIFTFDSAVSKVEGSEVTEHNEKGEKEAEYKSVTELRFDAPQKKLKDENFTGDPLQKGTKTNTLVKDASSIKDTETFQTKGKAKQSEPKSRKQKTGKALVDKSENKAGEAKLETPERETVQKPLNPETDSNTKNLTSEQRQLFPSLKREKSPLLALAPPWMAKLVQGDSNQIIETEKVSESSALTPSAKEAEIVSGALEEGIFGSVKERPKPLTMPEESKKKPEVAKKKQKRKGNGDLKVKTDLETSMKDQVDKSPALIESEKQNLTSSNSAKDKSNENVLSSPNNVTNLDIPNQVVEQTSEQKIKQKQKRADEKNKHYQEGKDEIEKQITSKVDIVQHTSKEEEKKDHKVDITNNQKKSMTDKINPKKKPIGDEELCSENKFKTETKTRKNTKLEDKKPKTEGLSENAIPSDISLTHSTQNIVEDMKVDSADSLTKDKPVEGKPYIEILSDVKTIELECKDTPSFEINKETTLVSPLNQVVTTKDVKKINDSDNGTTSEINVSDNYNIPQQNEHEIINLNVEVKVENFKIEESKEGSGNKGIDIGPEKLSGIVGSSDEDSFCSVPKYSLHEIEDPEKKLCGMKNMSEESDGLPLCSQNKSDGIVSWAEIAAKDKVTKEEKEEVCSDVDSVTKPLPIVICVAESEDQVQPEEPILTVDAEGFTEFVPKKEIRKRKSRSRSRTRTESNQLHFESNNTSKEISEVLGEKYPASQDKLESTTKESEKSAGAGKKHSEILDEPKKIENRNQLLTVANKSSRTRSRSRSQNRNRARSRSRNISETEKEVDDILRAWSREEVLQRNLPIDVTFWVDKWKFDDAEKHLYELFSNSSNEPLLTIDTDEKHGDDHDDKGPSSGPSSPGPRSYNDIDDQGNKFNAVTETLTADLPHGVGGWSDSSTFISDKTTQPSKEGKTYETPITSIDKAGSQDVQFGIVKETPLADLPKTEMGSNSNTFMLEEKSASQPLENNSSEKPTSSLNGAVIDGGNKFSVVTETLVADLTHRVGLLSESSSNISDEKFSSQLSEENSPSETPLITTSQFTKLSKGTLAADLDSLRRDLAVTEEQLRALPTEGVEAMLDALVKCGGDLKTHELTAGCIREGVLVLPQDEETEALQAEVDGVQERIVVLEQQVEAGKKKLQSCYDTKDKLHKEVGEYRHLMEELEKWVAGIKLMLNMDLHKDNAEEQILVHQKLLDDLAQQQKKLSELRSSCTNLESFEEVKDLALELNSSLALLDTELSSSKSLTEDRLKTLQDLLKVEPELPGPTPSPVAATYPVLSPVDSPVHEASRDDTIASNVSPIPDEEIVVAVLPDTEDPKPELVAQDSGTQTGRSLTLSPEKQIHMEVQTESPTERPAAVAIQTDDGGWERKVMPKGKIQILQKVEGNEETIEIATKSNVESHLDPETTRPGEDLTVEIKYKENKEGHEPTVSELNICHLEPQSFETIVMDPGESSTEVIVDADGTKRIVLRKTRKVISHRTMTSGVNMETVDMKPIAFSHVTLQQQQTSVTQSMPDGKSQITTSQGYVGQISSGTQDGTITTAQFSNMPQEVATYQTLPSHLDSQALETAQFDLAEPAGLTEWTSGSATVRAVVHQVRRRIIRRTRKIIRKVVIIDGKEHITEEVIEEPEEVEVSEDGVPRVSIEISKEGHGGMTVQEPFEEDHSLQGAGVEISEILPGDYYDDKLEVKGASPTTISPPSDSYEPKDQAPSDAPLNKFNKEPIQEKDPDLRLKELTDIKLSDAPSTEYIPDNGNKDANTLFIESEKNTVIPSDTICVSVQQITPLKEEINKNIQTSEINLPEKRVSPEFSTKDLPKRLSSGDKEPVGDQPDKTSKKGKTSPDKSSTKKSKRKSKEKSPSPEGEAKSPPGKQTPIQETHVKDENTCTEQDISSYLQSETGIDQPTKLLKPSIEDITSEISKTSTDDKGSLLETDKPGSPAIGLVESSFSEDEISRKSKPPQKRKSDKKTQKGKNTPDLKMQQKEISKKFEHQKQVQPDDSLVVSNLTQSDSEGQIPLIGEGSFSPKTVDEVDQKPGLICEGTQPEVIYTSEFIEVEENRKEKPEKVISRQESSVSESCKGNISELSDDGSKSTIPIVEKIEDCNIKVLPIEEELKKDKIDQETIQSSKTLGNIEFEITVKETADALKESIPKVVSNTKIEPKILHEDQMEIVKQKSDVVLPGVVQVTREVIQQIDSPLSSSSSDKSKKKKRTKIPSPEDLSTPTSLAESMEIVLPGSPNSSDTTKPTQQEIFEISSPRSDVSQLEESVKTYDTGYEGEDKTTVEESSMKDDDISKSKKKKKKKQKLKEISPDGHSSIEPKSSDFVPSDAVEDVCDSTAKDITVKKHKGKKPGKKNKVEKAKEDVCVAQSETEEIAEGSVKDLSDHSASDGIVKVVQESMPTRSSSEAEEFKSTNVLSSVPVLEVLPTQSESVQTTTPTPEDVPTVDTVEISTQVTQSTQETFAQTSTPEQSSIEVCIQTIPGELVPTIEESAQTLTPKVQSPVETIDSTMQTTEEEKPVQQEEEIQTDEVKFGSLDNVDNSMQTTIEETPVYLEETSQTSPEPEKIQSFSQVIASDLIPTEEEESQTIDQTITTVDLSTQIKSSDLIPTHDESMQTMVEADITTPVTELADKQEDYKPEVVDSKDIVPIESEQGSGKADKILAQPEAIKTLDSMSQTTPVKIKDDSLSEEKSYAPPSDAPFKIEIEATVTYGPEFDTDISTSELSKSDVSASSNQPPKEICAAPSDSTDSDVSSWASHKMRSPSPKNKKSKKPKQTKQKISEKEVSPVVKSTNLSPQPKTVEIEKSQVKPEVKAKITFDVDEYHSSVKPDLVAEISQDRNSSGVFIQAELKPEPNPETKEMLPGFSQTVELEISSEAGHKVEQAKAGKKSKKDRRIRQRADTKALPEASLVLSHEELRGEHSPGPPERVKDLEEPTNNKESSPLGSNIVSIQSTLTTPRDTKNVEFSSPSRSVDVKFTIHEGPDKSSLDRITITDNKDSLKYLQIEPKDQSSQMRSPDSYKIDSQIFIDHESVGDSISSQSEVPTDSDIEYLSNTDKSDLNERSGKRLKGPKNKQKFKKASETDDETMKDPEFLDSQLKKVGDVISNRIKQVQQTPINAHILYITSVEQEEPSSEERTNQLEDNLEHLQQAIKKQDVTIIQETIIVTVETISTWLETIEYKIQHTKQSSSHGTVPEQRLEELSHLQEEISRVESGVAALGDIVTQSDVCGQQNIRRVIDNLHQQVAIVEDTAKSTRTIADNDLARWEEFLNAVNNISVLVEQLRSELEELVEDQNTPASVKLQKLEALEATNNNHKAKCVVLLSTAHGLLRDFPGRLIPMETYTTQDMTQMIQHNINAEREKLLTLVSLAEEYEQTLKDFAQITDVAEALVDGPLVVSNLQHLQEEMQKHRKFFVNLSHSRGLLESLEGHLDSETRTKHAALHDDLHRRASMILDKAAGRAQQMAMAASRWTVLEQGMKEERGWLQVANQRVPDLSSVTTIDYNQYISMYQSLSSDIALHAARAGQLVCVAHGLQGVVQSESCAIYDEHHSAILALQAEVNTELGRLLAFRDSWTAYELLSDKLESWVRSVPMDTAPANMRQFWELKAQFELHKHLKDEAATHLDTALNVIPVADENEQRQLQTQLLKRWKDLEARLDTMQTAALGNLSAGSGSVEDKLSRLERELTELATLLKDMHGVIKTEEELQLYIERLQVMRGSVDNIMEQLSHLGLLSTTQSDRVSSLLAGARVTELSLREELEMASLLRDKLAALRRGLTRVRRDQQRADSVLDQCEASLSENQDTVQQALVNCQGVEETLATQWGELMSLRQLQHTLQSRLRLSLNPVRVERELAQLQDEHSRLTIRSKSLHASLAQRLALWRRFYSQLELVQQSVRETDYMMEILAVQGKVDYERLVKATERLEGLSESLGQRESQVEGLRVAAEPLQSSCSPEVAREIEAAVTEVVAAWEDTVTSLQGLCTRYQHAVQLWKQYRDASAALSQWADAATDAVDAADPREAVEHVKVSEEKLQSQQARLAELRELVAQIAADVGLDPEVLLGGEVSALGAKLDDVRETLAALVEAAEDKVERQERCAEDLREAKDFLTTVQKSLQAVDSSGGEGTLEQLTALRNHLIALGKSDGQLQALRDKTADLPPGKQDISVMDILQLWQQVFRETFQQYHRLSARLVRDQEGLEALRLWEEYLLHVQTFLVSAIPDDYNALSEHQNLCQVHQNLLSSQQSLLLNKPDASVELSVAEQFNSLTNLHNETLARIMEREAQVRNRMNIWDQYRNDHKALLAWLGDTEKEKNRLRLKYIHMRIIPKTMQRIQGMLDKLPVGEERAEKLGVLLVKLCQFCDDTLATSLRLEHSAVTDKINSMRAALLTWLKFLKGLRELTERYEREVETVQRTFSDIHGAMDDVTEGTESCVPASYHMIQQRLDSLKAARERVAAVSSDLDLLGVTQEQLKESLNPVDVKTVSQRVWLLHQQQGDLEHQLDMAIYQLEERLQQGQMFDKRVERFLVWAGGVDRRLESLSSGGTGEPADQLRRLETELEAEVGLRRREADWLRDCGTELVDAEGLEATPRRAELTKRLNTVNTAWERVQQLTSARANKLRQIIEGMSTLEQRIEELRGWLHSIELKLATPIILEHCTQAGLDRCTAHHDALTKDIEQHSGPVADVLNHCELLLNDCDSANVQLNTDGISTSMQLLERRWKNVCILVTERKAKLLRTWQLLQEVLRLCEEQTAWLRTQTEALDRLREQTDGARIQALPGLIADVERVLTEVECQRPALELLQSSYTTLATQSSLDSLTADARSRIAEWSALRSRADELLHRLHVTQDRWLRFTEAHGAAVLAMTDVDVQLTQIDLLETSDDADLETFKNKLKKLIMLKKELERRGALLKTADQLGLDIMNSCVAPDVPFVQQMIDEYQLLWKDITERINKLIETSREECRKRNVVNEEVQVETLKFETDSSVQVNTLPTPLLRKDAYNHELQTAIKECNSNLEALSAIERLTNQNSAKCLAACQASVDLVRHLSNLLMEECGATAEEACSTEVEQLERRYREMLAQKQTEDRERRELSESGRFTCPLCTRRNWKQLENDLWRLQKWLEFAEATQAAQTSPPSNINQLEDVIQDQREFLLDLDSHKSLVVSLNTVGRHLAEHTEDEARARDMTERLAGINQRWDNVCGAAVHWETKLQTALLQNPEFHETIDELVQWLEQTETAIQQMEPVDVADGREVIESKYNKFKDLRHDLEVCEPRVLSLQEAACHLLRHRGSEATDTDACERLTHLRLRLQSLTRLTGSYLLKLGTVLGKDPVSHTSSLAALSHELLDQAAGGAASSRSSTDQLHSNSEGLVDTSVLARGYRFLGRVVRASLPIQALMLVMLGVASLVPITEEDFACSISRTFGPTLRYVNGPPPM